MKDVSSWGEIAPLLPKTPFPTKNEAHIKTVQMHRNFVGGMAVDEKYLFTSSEDGTVKIWHRKSLDHVGDVDFYDSPVNYIAISSDGEFFATADDSNKVVVYQRDRKKIFKTRIKVNRINRTRFDNITTSSIHSSSILWGD